MTASCPSPFRFDGGAASTGRLCWREEGGADAAALQGFHVDFSRQRSLWRGTRPSGEVEWWELSDSSCSSRECRIVLYANQMVGAEESVVMCLSLIHI